MGEHAEAGEGTEGLGLPAGDGDAAPGSPGVPAEKAGEDAAGEGAGEGEGSEKKGEAWSKDKAEITRLQQERAELQTKAATAERAALVANAKLELSRRQSAAPTAAERRAVERTPDQKAAAAAVNDILRDELGMDLAGLKSKLQGIDSGIGSTAIAALDARFSADPEQFPHYAEVRGDLLTYAREQGGRLTPDGFEYAFMKLQQPLLLQERKATKAAKAKVAAAEKAAVNRAQLPGGGSAGGEGDRVISLADLSDPSKVSTEDLERMTEEMDLDIEF